MPSRPALARSRRAVGRPCVSVAGTIESPCDPRSCAADDVQFLTASNRRSIHNRHFRANSR